MAYTVYMSSLLDSLPMTLHLVLLPVLAVAIFGFVGLILAGRFLLLRRRFERRVATLSYLVASEFSSASLADRRTFNFAIARLSSLGEVRADALTKDENEALVRILNRYELEAIAVKHRTFDRDIILDFKRSTIKKDWERVAPIVYSKRIDSANDKLYEEFEAFSFSLDDRLSRLSARERRALLTSMFTK